MPEKLTAFQRKVALERIQGELASPQMQEAIMRSTLATAENEKSETGVAEFICALYLQFGDEFRQFWTGDLDSLVASVFPKHRAGHLGLVPQQTLDAQDAEGESCGTGVGWQTNLADDLFRLLWDAGRIARSVGKPVSMRDIVAAIAMQPSLPAAVRDRGISLRSELRSIEEDIGGVIFAFAFFADPQWPTSQNFELSKSIRLPFTVEIRNPHSRFRPVKQGDVLLNGQKIAAISEAMPVITAPVKLKHKNTITVDLLHSRFAAIGIVVREAESATAKPTKAKKWRKLT